MSMILAASTPQRQKMICSTIITGDTYVRSTRRNIQGEIAVIPLFNGSVQIQITDFLGHTDRAILDATTVANLLLKPKEMHITKVSNKRHFPHRRATLRITIDTTNAHIGIRFRDNYNPFDRNPDQDPPVGYRSVSFNMTNSDIPGALEELAYICRAHGHLIQMATDPKN